MEPLIGAVISRTSRRRMVCVTVPCASSVRDSGLLDRFDFEADLHFVPHQDATGLERGVPVETVVLTVDLRAGAEAGHGEAVGALVGAQELALQRHLARDAADG